MIRETANRIASLIDWLDIFVSTIKGLFKSIKEVIPEARLFKLYLGTRGKKYCCLHRFSGNCRDHRYYYIDIKTR